MIFLQTLGGVVQACVPELGRRRQEDCCESEGGLGYTVSSTAIWITVQGDLVSKAPAPPSYPKNTKQIPQAKNNHLIQCRMFAYSVQKPWNQHLSLSAEWLRPWSGAHLPGSWSSLSSMSVCVCVHLTLCRQMGLFRPVFGIVTIFAWLRKGTLIIIKVLFISILLSPFYIHVTG